MSLLAGVAGAGALGAVARYLLDRAVAARWRHPLPVATLVVNTSGTLALGLLLGASMRQGLDPGTETILGAGFCGGYTTFSTFAVETVRLVHGGRRWTAVAYAASSLVLGLAAAGLGLALTGV